MGGQLGGESLPLAHQPRHLVLGLLTLAGDGASAFAVGIQRGIAKRLAERGETFFERVDLTLHLVEATTDLADLTARAWLRGPPPRGQLDRRSGRRRRRLFASGDFDQPRFRGEVIVVVAER